MRLHLRGIINKLTHPPPLAGFRNTFRPTDVELLNAPAKPVLTQRNYFPLASLPGNVRVEEVFRAAAGGIVHDRKQEACMPNSVIRFATLAMFLAGLGAAAPLVPAPAAR